MPVTAPTAVTYSLDNPSAVAVPDATVTAKLLPTSAGDRSDDGAVVVGTVSTTTDSNGAFSLPLIPNAAFRTSGTWYWVEIAGGPGYAIVVPVSATPVSLWACVVDRATLDPVTPAAAALYVLRAELGAASGAASLDADGLVPEAQLPPSQTGGVQTIAAADASIVVGGTTADRTIGVGAVPQASVTGLVAALGAKAATTATDALDTRLDALEAVDPLTQTEGDARYSQLGHTHTIANVTGLQAALDALPGVAATTQAGSYTLALADAGTAVEFTAATGVNCTVPPNSVVAFPLGTVIEVLQYGAGQVTVVAGGGVTIRTASSLTSRAQYSTLSLRKRATDEWVLAGDAT